MSVDFFEPSYKKYLFLGSICIAQNFFAYWWMGGHYRVAQRMRVPEEVD